MLLRKLSFKSFLHQADLVNLAFAGPDLEAEFEAFKKQEIDDELGIDAKRKKIISQGNLFKILLQSIMKYF